MRLLHLLSISLVIGWACCASGTPLDDYVAAPDPNFSYALVNTLSEADYSATIWEVTSQAWRDPSEVDRTLWKHWLVVIIPDTVLHTKALMWIGAGDNGGSAPGGVDGSLLFAALSTNSIVAEIRMIPNQTLGFPDETDPRYLSSGRREDQMIAYAWDKYKKSLDDGMEDPLWLPRLPMTKAVVRGMDIVQAEYPSITGFMVAGASKRGWTTWTTAAVDPRVEAIAPQVIDVLNVDESMRHHFEAYGFWADAVGDYVDMGIMDWLGTPQSRSLFDIVDPYSYRGRLDMPKLIVNSCGDQFFLPDSSRFYFDDLVGEKHLCYVPNTDHGLNYDAAINTFVFYYTYLNNLPRPSYTWSQEADGTLHVQTATAPTAVRLWQATNPTARDFRLGTIGAAWTSSLLSDQGGGVYEGSAPEPAQGWRAFFVELEFPGAGPYSFKFTTGVSVVPDVLPFAPPPTATPAQRSLSASYWSLYD